MHRLSRIGYILKRYLLVMNYVMDDSNPILSHQIQAVRELSNDWDQITVVTGEI